MSATLDMTQLVTAIGRVAARDRAALQTIYRETSATLFGVCVRILKDRKDAKVIFVFTAPNLAKSFLDRAADNLPYLWCWATDILSFKRDPKGKLFGCPKNDDLYSFSG